MSNISVIGLGYIGLPTALVLATHGHQVAGVDISPEVVRSVKSGAIPLQEPGLKKLMGQVVRSGKLTASQSIGPSDIFIIAVPTPLASDRTADLSHVTQACKAIVPHLGPGNLVIIESTIPPGTTTDVVLPILETCGLFGGSGFYLAHCPERVLPGMILKELLHNSRIIGGINPASSDKAADLYRSFSTGTIYCTNSKTAELVKLSENTFRDVNIALANELASIASEVGSNVWETIELANKHPRVNILSPGPGVGGHCIPIDPWFLINTLQRSSGIISKAREINDLQPKQTVRQILDLLGDCPNPKVALLGAAYKADISDSRESPAISVIEELEKSGVRVLIHDPHTTNFCRPISTLPEVFKEANLVVLLTGHKEYQSINIYELGNLMTTKALLDTRNVLDHKQWREANFSIFVLGISSEKPT